MYNNTRLPIALQQLICLKILKKIDEKLGHRYHKHVIVCEYCIVAVHTSCCKFSLQRSDQFVFSKAFDQYV